MKCTLCNQFQGTYKIVTYEENKKRVRAGLTKNRNHIVPKFTWEELQTSAKSCYCCKIIQTGCLGCFNQHGIKESEVVTASLRFFYPTCIELVEESDSSKTIIFQLKDGKRFEVEIFATENEDCLVPDSWDYIAVSKRTSPATDSSMALVTIKGWLAECITCHSGSSEGYCNYEELPELPTRVVDVGLNDGVVKLRETEGAKGKYLCLSHCWGLAQIITTTNSTIHDRKKGITWDELSRTFRDAISLTRALGFDYIWIDSLCIIQDDARDWEIESAKMASVYSRGFLTIAATHSANGAGGMFSPTGDCGVSGKSPDGDEFRLYFRERIDHHIEAIYSMENLSSNGSKSLVDGNPTTMYSPLLTRAWVYQERMLSTRTLHFSRYEMFFECKSSIQCECDCIRLQDSIPGTSVPLIKVEYSDTLEMYRNGQEAMKREIEYHGARLWRTMVCSYTALLLTKSKDRLPAISGLAKQLASGRKSRYLAGLWEQTLQDDLLWIIRTTSRSKKPRPFPPNAPSWSWASVETWVSYWDEILFTNVEAGDFEDQLPCEHFCEIQKCEVSLSGADEFASISQGRLTISGQVRNCTLEREIGFHNGAENIVHYFSFSNTRLPMKSDYLLDAEGPGQTLPMTRVFCLRMSLIQEGRKEMLISLVLKRSPDFPEYYERIGALIISGEVGSVDPNGDLFRTSELKTLTIV
ncbi:hypothetical protein HYFRA_00013863 [Hymenoscyphus fraxineus]|uniref:Heterokaryon incompatibility domain-containing protein n=1 Tax=Hymenoscyphus fraxineus TaxID=746836 RepID=A0A9N9LDJ9_9HELO|nr:hypothetical protein HYFRA_00013863 [Hymenoscyphus fraxineus]